MKELHNIDLKDQNTFGLKCLAKKVVCLESVEELVDYLQTSDVEREDFLILGGGSNVILPEELDQTVLRLMFDDIQYQALENDRVLIKVEAGRDWDELVEDTVRKGLSGLENLSYIPGTTGAAPVQNIGAYGVELADVLLSVVAFDMAENRLVELNRDECQFAYRDSLFKRQPGRYCIVSLNLCLSKVPGFKLEYGELRTLQESEASLTAAKVRQKVIEVRRAKLPDPRELSNAGSFFKNPIISKGRYKALKRDFPDVVSYPLEDGQVKVAAGWLIEQAGMKGMRQGLVGVHTNQALVLINHGGASQADVLALAGHIQDRIKSIYSVELEIEPLLISSMRQA